MKALKWLPVLIGLCFWQAGNTQTIDRCQSDHKMQVIYDANPEYQQQIESGFQQFYQFGPVQQRSAQSIITIPVHVIIIHPPGQSVGQGDNLPMDHIMSQIDVLNEDFRALNADVNGVPNVFTAGDSEIEFCLASVDPNGNPTDGVTRYATNQSMSNNEFSLKQTTGWPRNQYLNIWVDPNIGPLGWAYLPSTTNLPNAVLDGCVIRTSTFGGPGFATLNPYNLGRTTTHEVGHYLGLNHIWRNGGCGQDDGIADTPIQDNENYGCPNHPSPSCGNGGDMFMNYMDYVNDNCMIMFSPDQGAYMRQILNTSRSSLLTAANTVCNLAVPMVASIAIQTDALCFGENSGTATVDVSGGTEPYTYSLNGDTPQSSPVFSGLFAGNYVITVIDANGSQIDVPLFIDEPDVLNAIPVLETGASCFGEADGLVEMDAFGGTPPYAYSLDGSTFSADNIFTNLTAGTYNISVQDGNGCIVTSQVMVDQPEEIAVSTENLVNVDCNGAASGSISLDATGGTPGYEYSLDNMTFQSLPTFEDLEGGDYTAYVQDANSCVTTYLFSIEEPSELTAAIDMQTDPSCEGNDDGALSVLADGGIPPYSYSLDGVNFQDDNLFTNLTTDDYQIVIQDANNCESIVNASLTAPEAVSLILDDQQNIDCPGEASGAFSVSANGGTGTLSYTLDGDTVADGNFDNLPAGEYTVMVTDQNNCSSSLLITIEEPAALAIDQLTQSDVSCNGDADASLSISATGGNGPYSYNLEGTQNTSGQFDALAAGDYSLTITDANNCTSTAMLTINEPEALSIDQLNVTDADCNGNSTGAISLSANGGTGQLTFSLSGNTNNDGTFDNLNAGTYTIMVTDENGCTESVEATVEEPEALSLNMLTQTDVSCAGAGDGSIALTAQGGAGNYTYELDGDQNTSGTFDNLSAGDYTIIVTDENNCSENIQLTIDAPNALSLDQLSLADVTCADGSDGSLDASVSGGNAPYTYNLDGQQNDSGLFSDLSAGDYTLMITDANGCTTSESVSISAPEAISVAVLNVTDVDCNGNNTGAISLSANGGTGELSFSLSGNTNTTGTFDNLSAGTYSVQVIDANNCTESIDVLIEEPEAVDIAVSNLNDVSCFGESDGSLQLTSNTSNIIYSLEGQTNMTGFFDGLSGGTYTLMAQNANGCTSMVEVTIDEPEAVNGIIVKLDNVSCNGDGDGSISLTAEGGMPGYEYNLNGETNTNGLFFNMDVGDYTVVITDANGCTDNIELTIAEPEELTATTQLVTGLACAGDQNAVLQVDAQGGNGGYTYSLNENSNTTGTFSGLSAGVYPLLVEDEAGCELLTDFVVTQPEPIELDIIQTAEITCAGDATAAIQLIAEGGNGPFTYIFEDLVLTDGAFDGLEAGSYQFSVIDGNSCMVTESFTIQEPMAITGGVNDVLPVLCAGDANAVIQLFAFGGSGNYSFTLDEETNTDGVFEGLSAGNYTAVITDNNDCSQNLNVVIEEPAALAASTIIAEPIACTGDQNGVMEVVAEGGTGPYIYSLGEMTNGNGQFENLSAGTYAGVVEDANGCQQTFEFELSDPAPITATIEVQDIACFGESTGIIEVNGSGGTGMLQYLLNGFPGSDGGSFTNVLANDYVVQILDENNCTELFEVTVEEPEALELDWTLETPIACFGENNAAISLAAAGGTGGYTYLLGGVEVNPEEVNGLSAGTYEAVVIDENDCEQSISFEIEQPTELSLEVSTQTDDNGTENGSFTLLTQNGTPPYVYSVNGGPFLEVNAFSNLPAGDYEVVVMDDNGCETTIVVTIDLMTSIADLETGVNDIQVWPNPFHNQIVLEVDLAKAQQLQFRLYNVHGQVLIQQQKRLGSGMHQWALEGTADLPPATYILTISNEEKSWHQKLIKQ